MNKSELNFQFNGVNIYFAPSVDNNVMINATELVRLYPGKRINNFLRNDHTKALIKQLETETRKSATELIVIVKGGQPQAQGTWMHEKLALAFALWLDVEFFSWCLGKIKEIIVQGYAVRDTEFNNMVANNASLQTLVNQLTPKAQFYDDVLANSNYKYNFTDVCRILNLNLTRRTLAQVLIDRGFAYRNSRGKGFYLKNPYCTMGYLGTVTVKVNGQYKKALRWSDSGLAWLFSLMNNWGFINPMCSNLFFNNNSVGVVGNSNLNAKP